MVFSLERRIAFKMELGTVHYRFLRQTNSGTWESKNGTGSQSAELPSGITPENPSAWNTGGSTFDSDVIYFAINNNGESQYYEAF